MTTALDRFPPTPGVTGAAVLPAATLRWSDQDVARRLWATIDELTAEYGDRYSDARIIGVAIGALRDLRGSTGVDALPELISRLVRVRLPVTIPSGGSDAG